METFGMFALGAILGAVTGFVAAVRMVATIRRKRDRAEVGYVARDKDGELWLYPEKPYKTDDDCWTTRSFVSMRVYPERFATVSWDDEEPTKVCLIESSELV